MYEASTGQQVTENVSVARKYLIETMLEHSDVAWSGYELCLSTRSRNPDVDPSALGLATFDMLEDGSLRKDSETGILSYVNPV